MAYVGSSESVGEAWPPLVQPEGAERLRSLEFYSGIGGMHMALRQALHDNKEEHFEVVAAFDLNNVANDVRGGM